MPIVQSVKYARIVIGLTVGLGILVGGSYFLIASTINVLIKRDVEAAVFGWANYFSRSLDEIEQIAAGEIPSAESASLFEEARKIGQVFRFKLFDANGRLRLASDELDTVGRGDPDLAEHNAEAAAALASGQTYTTIKEGTPPTRPVLYAESYVPVMKDGQTVAIVALYLDQTAKQQLFRSQFRTVSLFLVTFIALNFGLPTAVFFWRTQKKRWAEERFRRLREKRRSEV